MRSILEPLAHAVARYPARLLLVAALLTAVMGVLASQQQVEPEMTAFAPDTELTRAFDRVQEDFSVGGGLVQVIVDAGPDGDVLTPAGVRAAAEASATVEGMEETDGALAPPSAEGPPVVSFALPVIAALEEQGTSLAEADDETIAATIETALSSDEGRQAAGLLSSDRHLEEPSARAGLVLVRLSPDLTETEQNELGVTIGEEVDELTPPERVELLPFSPGILFEELERGMTDELPMLLGLSFLLVLLILVALYRSVVDVLLGLVGLVVTIVWMYGAGVLLGPEYLGITGHFTQISIVIPVLLVGLGIDYAIHLTSRYREERIEGDPPAASAATAVRTVGGALVLATITTVVAFLANLLAPLPPMRDFGLFTASGILAAFLIMTTVVPAARSLIDRRRDARPQRAGSGQQAGPLSLTRVVANAAVLTERLPVTTLIVALAVTAVAAYAGTQVSTEFSQRDFIPDDSYGARVLDLSDELFGGDLGERTYVLVEGDLMDPQVANAVLEAQERMGSTELVRSFEGRVDVRSAPGLVAATAGQAAQRGDEQLLARMSELGWSPEGLAPDADLEQLYAIVREASPGQLQQLLTDDASAGLIDVGTTAGEQRVDDLREQLLIDVEPVADAGAEVTVVSEPLVTEEILDAMTDSQVQSIVLTLLSALVLLVAYYGLRDRRPLLGVVTMVPSTLSVAWVVGSMWVLGLTFNVMTMMVAALAIGIGVPYGIHITHRFVEDRERATDVEQAMRSTIAHTGGALASSAATTAAGFGVLVFASLRPIQQFGGITALTIVYALVGSVLIQPSLLVLWDRFERGRGREPEREPVEVAG